MDNIFYCAEKKIDLQTCKILYNRPFTAVSLEEDFETASGSWSVDSQGWLTGLHRDNSGGILYSKKGYNCDVIMEFTARTVPPCCNDLNFVFRTCGWNYEKNDADRGYIGGLGGWWTNNVGLEKYPTCLPRALTPLFSLEAGKSYHIVTGSISGHCFIFVDGKLLLEMTDPAPEDFADCGRFGFGTYASHIQFRDFTLYRADFTPHSISYHTAF